MEGLRSHHRVPNELYRNDKPQLRHFFRGAFVMHGLAQDEQRVMR